MPEVFSSLAPLPGGNGRYLETLTQALLWLQETKQPTRATFANWFKRHYHAAPRSIDNYIHVFPRLNMIDIDDLGQISLTEFGNQIIDLEHSEQARQLIDYLMPRFIGLFDILAVYATAPKPIHIRQIAEDLSEAFPQWTHLTPVMHRALWLLSLGCLEQVSGRYYQVTEVGQAVYRRYAEQPPVRQTQFEPVSVCKCGRSHPEALVDELNASAVDSRNPQRMQAAVAAAFHYLGFEVQELGKPGETDILVSAHSGSLGYAVSVDTKSRYNGKLQGMSPETLRNHAHQHGAQYTVVVAQWFAEGKLMDQAHEYGIGLLPVEILGQWVVLHSQTPLNLQQQRYWFEQKGLIADIPAEITQIVQNIGRTRQLLVDLLTLIGDSYMLGLERPLSGDHLFNMLVTRLQALAYSGEEVQLAISFLTHPLIGILSGSEEGVYRVGNLDYLSLRLETLIQDLAG